jgi:hypothetical protein
LSWWPPQAASALMPHCSLLRSCSCASVTNSRAALAASQFLLQANTYCRPVLTAGQYSLQASTHCWLVPTAGQPVLAAGQDSECHCSLQGSTGAVWHLHLPPEPCSTPGPKFLHFLISSRLFRPWCSESARVDWLLWSMEVLLMIVIFLFRTAPPASLCIPVCLLPVNVGWQATLGREQTAHVMSRK